MKDILLVLKAPDWPRRAWYTDLVELLSDAPLTLPGCLHLLSIGPIYHPAARLLGS